MKPLGGLIQGIEVPNGRQGKSLMTGAVQEIILEANVFF